MNRRAYPYDEAAEQLGVSKDLIRQLVADGELLAFTVTSNPDARSKRISGNELDRFIAMREETQRQKCSSISLGDTAQNRA
ncbi:excisionase family DNA-binding protein [Deinococcus sp. SM5_A1]|uniref:excisionase family DNA-binding protein n=1 Tax=Deinococcus sp. SM5_A1 TaxID=3379094 RepID=UPI00385D7411